MASSAQVKRIFTAARRAGLSREEIQKMAERISGQKYILKLSYAQARIMITQIERKK